VPGRLFVCGTPIGNLEDATLRLLRILGEVDMIAAEDTRRTRKLLAHHGIRAKLVSYHQANERQQTGHLIKLLKAGSHIALVSDGGMPAISDPGYLLVTRAIAEGVAVQVIPGPSAILSALVASGLPTARFSFEGFLPRGPGEKSRRLQAVSRDDRTLVFFESPSRVRATLEAIHSELGDRQMALARELTKVHEEVVRGRVSELIEAVPDEVLGEVVLVVEGSKDRTDLESAVEFARQLVVDGMPKSRAAAEAAARFNAPRRSVYEGLLAQPEENGSHAG
jgi:16S rRNA (cytidine1402-2'-O)-methyltransferase